MKTGKKQRRGHHSVSQRSKECSVFCFVVEVLLAFPGKLVTVEFQSVAYLEFTKGGGPIFDKLKSCDKAESLTEILVGVRMIF